jgi:hypothetical protein
MNVLPYKAAIQAIRAQLHDITPLSSLYLLSSVYLVVSVMRELKQ